MLTTVQNISLEWRLAYNKQIGDLRAQERSNPSRVVLICSLREFLNNNWEVELDKLETLIRKEIRDVEREEVLHIAR